MKKPNKHEQNEKYKVSIIESHLQHVIENYKNDPSTAFSHCASADLEDVNQMSRGIAVVFKRNFGKPLHKDRIDKNIARQEIDNGAVIYTLLTKPKYYLKPSVDDYNASFEQFAADFSKRNLKKLICSPMGCVRDEIAPELFVDNIIKFQQRTGAKISIIVHSSNPKRILKNGMTHEQFLETLNSLLSIKQDTSITNCMRDRSDLDNPNEENGMMTSAPGYRLSAAEVLMSSRSMVEFPPLPTRPVHGKAHPTAQHALITHSALGHPTSGVSTACVVKKSVGEVSESECVGPEKCQSESSVHSDLAPLNSGNKPPPTIT